MRRFAQVCGVLLLVYLCWRLVAPFLPALSWALAVALVAQPLYAWLLKRRIPPNLAALGVLVLTVCLVAGPGALLARSLAAEAAQAAGRMGADSGREVRAALERNAAAIAGWVSGRISRVLSGSVWVVTQVSIALFVLFYFLRDGERIVSSLKPLIPLSETRMEAIATRIALTVRVSLGAKLLMGTLQGVLGGLMFAWLGIPAPVFWGAVMVFFSIVPILGAFVVWAPAAVYFALQSDWKHALILTAWGVIVIHPVDNLLGPVLVGTTLRLHTLLMFFSVVGGMAAFGAAGIVLGPVIVAVVSSLRETADERGTVWTQ
jgi:predicted PurR-regulated permease PerM